MPRESEPLVSVAPPIEYIVNIKQMIPWQKPRKNQAKKMKLLKSLFFWLIKYIFG